MVIKRVAGSVPTGNYKESDTDTAELIIRRCKTEIAVLFAVGGIFAIILLISFSLMFLSAGNGKDIYDLLIPIGFFGPIYYFYRSSGRIKILKRYASRATQGQFKYCLSTIGKKKMIVALIEGENLVIDKVDSINQRTTTTSIQTKFKHDVLINKAHAISVVILTLLYCISTLVYKSGLISKAFYGSILAMPLGIFIISLIVSALCMIIKNSDNRYSTYVLWIWVHVICAGDLYLLSSENKIITLFVSVVLFASIGFVLFFINKDLITIERALSNEQFRSCQATVIKKIGSSNHERIFPVSFGYLTVLVEDQHGIEYKVKMKSSLYNSISEGDKGTLITLDEADSKRLFII